MSSLMEVIDVTILGTAIASLLVSIIKIKKKKKTKQTYENRKDLR